jgi:DNA polymerase-3 subunit beta
MKVTVSKDALANILRKVLNAVNAKTTIPVLNNVYLEANANGLTLAATDLEVYVKSTTAASVEREGKTTLPARKFAQIVGALPEGDVVLDTDNGQQTAISCKKSFFKIVGLDAEEFPAEESLVDSWEFTIAADEFRKILSKVSYAASMDETRHVLNGILLSIRSGIMTAVGTDGRRLALLEKSLDTEAPTDCDVILPAKTVGELIKILDTDAALKVEISDTRVAFSLGQTLIVSKLVEGSYPNYRQVIPASFTLSAVLPRDLFSTVLNRVAMVVSETSASVTLKLDKALALLSANSAEIGEGNESFEMSYDGNPVEISFNPQFLMDPLKHLESDQVLLQFNDEFSPVSLSGDEGFLYVIMPMRS